MRHYMNSATILLFELLQIALGYKTEFSHLPSEREWRELNMLAKRQALLGIAFAGIEHLPKEQRPPKPLLIQWILAAEHIRSRNIELNDKTVAISNKFRADGFRNIILKGQGIAKYYGELACYRTSGDVDIWLEGKRKDIIAYARRHDPDCKVVYHHVDFPKIDGVDVEVHFTPSWMNSYFTNGVLQRYFNQNRDILFAQCDSDLDEIPTPSLEFNRVYIIVHIYRHLFHEGIGLRQLMDYYFVLRQGFTEEERSATMHSLHSLGMKRFTSAVMWVLQEVFGIEDKYLLTPPNQREGHFLLNEIMQSGNFGQYDKSLGRNRNESDLLYALRKLRRIFRFIYRYPSEVLWSPLFKVWHYFWRKKMQTG